ncbi:MAG TPA: tetratricopeptide repeat protein [Anaerolineales bacterium]|nr:tetratricopeptide repeat protein [Anaerolineales bacterium]
MVKKKRKSAKLRQQLSDDLKGVYLIRYEITDEPILDRRYRRLPSQVKNKIEELHFKAQENPKEAIPELNELIKEYPDLPMLYNYLSVAYAQAGHMESAEAVIQENYRRNPDYLFARLNYAERCLQKGEYERVKEIFEHKFDLQMLYPMRKRFHITEVAGFMGIMGWYFVEKGEPEVAEKYFEILKQIAPDNPMTNRLRRILYPGLLQRLLLRSIGKKREEKMGDDNVDE